jgi:DNA-binding MarR family transcriptional regulator
MARKTAQNRNRMARALIAMDETWIELFADLNMEDLSYSDLLTHMWLHGGPVNKTELYAFMPSISQRTAVKYVQRLIDEGLLRESESANDRRVRQVELTAPLIERLERFYDRTARHFAGT